MYSAGILPVSLPAINKFSFEIQLLVLVGAKSSDNPAEDGDCQLLMEVGTRIVIVFCEDLKLL